MRSSTLAGSALLLALAAAPLAAQGTLPPNATAPIPSSRMIVSLEVSAKELSNRLPSEWAKAIPDPLLDELAADENFAGIDLGVRDNTYSGASGNGIIVRFDFESMDAYREWDARPETQQLLAELRQAIGYGYSRTSLSMRRIPNDAHHLMPTAPRRVPVPNVPQGDTQATARAT